MSYKNSGVMTTQVMSEKVEMQGLNDKLADFMDMIKAMYKSNAGALDPAKYQEMLRKLEAEINKMRNLYEEELKKLRKQLEEANRLNAALSSSTANDKGLVAELQAKAEAEANRARRAENDVNNLNSQLATRDKEVADLLAQCHAMKVELDRLRPEASKSGREVAELREQLDAERKARQQLESRSKVLGEKVNFDNKKYGELEKDLKERIAAANDIIVSLEKKIKQLSNDNASAFPQMLQKLRDGTAEDMRRFQRETEEALNAQLAAIKKQTADEAERKRRLEREKAALEEALQKCKANCGALDGENTGLRNEIKALKGALSGEKSSNYDQIRDLEARLKDCQEQLMAKVGEFNSARDAQATLRAEIDQYRQLLNIGKESLQKPQTSKGNSYGSTERHSAKSCPLCAHGGPCNKGAMHKQATTPPRAVGTGAGLPKIAGGNNMTSRSTPQRGGGYNTTYHNAYCATNYTRKSMGY